MPVTWAPTVDDLRDEVEDLERYLPGRLRKAQEADRVLWWQGNIDTAVSELLEAARSGGCPIPNPPTSDAANVLTKAALALAGRNSNVTSSDPSQRSPLVRWAEGFVADLRKGTGLFTAKTSNDVGAFVVLTPPRSDW